MSVSSSSAANAESLSGRLLIAALSQLDRADAAERDVIRMAFLSDLENQLLGSLETGRTRETVAQVVLPELDAWTVVDIVEPGGEPYRLSLVHPSFPHPEILDVLNASWRPTAEEPIGFWAAKRAKRTIIIVDDIETVLAKSSGSPEVLAALGALHVSGCLVVPMWSVDELDESRSLDGAMTFMSTRREPRFGPDEIAFAELVARSCGRALRNSRLFESLNRRRLAAERENKSTSDMLGRVSHELRTPLAAIGGYAELLQLGVRGSVNDAQRQDLERIRWNQQHLLSLITQILNFVRVDTGRIEFVREELDLGTLMRESVDMLTPLIAEKHQIFRMDQCDPGEAVAIGDSDKVRQIAINLITNALKYSPPTTEIVVRCETVGDTVHAEIADLGPGIAADKIEAIFLPFVQLAGGAADRQSHDPAHSGQSCDRRAQYAGRDRPDHDQPPL